jgi:pimeloyl-ACP methyl ester carboxylesterase
MALTVLEQRGQGDGLLVLLPGAGMRAEDYVSEGFSAAAARCPAAPDLLVVDIDSVAATAGNLAEVVEQVLLPRRAAHRRLWLGGISLGGMLALGLHVDHPGLIDGLCLIAPYPGTRLTLQAIDQAGGLASWIPDEAQLADAEFRMWHWLRSPPADFPVFAGYGADDRFAAGMARLAGCFPPACRRVVAGAHDWPTWRLLWEDFLAQGHFSPR